MTSIWQQLTLSGSVLTQWFQYSYVGRFAGLLRSWRQGSWLLQWSEPLGFGLLSAVFGLAPFVTNALIGLLLLACGAFWLIVTLSDDREVGGLTPIHGMVTLFWGVMTLAMGLSLVRRAAFEGWTKLTLYVLLFLLMARVLRSPRWRSWLITVYLHASLIVSVYGIRQRFFGATALATWVDPESPLSNTIRVYSFLGNPNLLAAYLLPAIALSAVAIFHWRGWVPKLLAVTMFGLNTACLILTYSRGGWIGFLALAFVLSVLMVQWWSIRFSPFWRVWALPVLLGAMVSVGVLAVLFVEPLQQRVLSIFAGREDSSNNFRINVWMSVLEMIRDRPILGIGPGNDAFNLIYPAYQRPRFSALSAYSVFLEVTVEAGLLGLASFLGLLFVAFNQGWSSIQRLRLVGDRDGLWLIAAIAAIAGLLAHGLVDTVWYRPQVNTLWWFCLALLASFYLPRSRMADETPESSL